jgi:hypothetical protein
MMKVRVCETGAETIRQIDVFNVGDGTVELRVVDTAGKCVPDGCILRLCAAGLCRTMSLDARHGFQRDAQGRIALDEE